jgi:hypothetical protein
MDNRSLRESPTAGRRRAQQLALATLVLLADLGLASHGAAGPTTERDLRQTVRARQVLLEDPELAALNLGVTVRDRAATLWGPVPSVELALKAERALRNLFELTAVRNDLELSRAGEANEVPQIPGGPTSLPDKLPPALPRLQHGASIVFDKASLTVRPPTRLTPKKPAPDLVLPRIDVPARMPLAPEQTANAAKDLEATLDALLQSKEAYRSIAFTVRGGRVYLRGAGHAADILHELARTISHLPGVDGVTVQER